jgi:A/G-specific adenine glycosylase
VAIVARHGGVVPQDVAALEALPGIGHYTARAVASFAFGQRHPVIDTNVRRVVARWRHGQGEAGPAAPARDSADLEPLLPGDPARAARFAVALMELGALVCTARSPGCAQCPVSADCAWRAAGAPPYLGPRRPAQRYAGTDRQARGRLLDVLRASDRPVSGEALAEAWPAVAQRNRALHGLVVDGLVEPMAGGRYALPTSASARPERATSASATPAAPGGLRRTADAPRTPTRTSGPAPAATRANPGTAARCDSR